MPQRAATHDSDPLARHLSTGSFFDRRVECPPYPLAVHRRKFLTRVKCYSLTSSYGQLGADLTNPFGTSYGYTDFSGLRKSLNTTALLRAIQHGAGLIA